MSQSALQNTQLTTQIYYILDYEVSSEGFQGDKQRSASDEVTVTNAKFLYFSKPVSKCYSYRYVLFTHVLYFKT